MRDRKANFSVEENTTLCLAGEAIVEVVDRQVAALIAHGEWTLPSGLVVDKLDLSAYAPAARYC